MDENKKNDLELEPDMKEKVLDTSSQNVAQGDASQDEDVADIKESVKDTAQELAEAPADETAQPSSGQSISNQPNKRFCPKCGEVLAENSNICGGCGHVIQVAPQKAVNTPANSKKTRKLIGGVVALIAIIVLCVLVIPQLTISVDELIDQSRFEEAYKKAGSEEKASVINAAISANEFETAYKLDSQNATNILVANAAAYFSKEIRDNLYDPDSYRLRAVYYDSDDHRIVLEINGNNKLGGKVVGYYYYTFDKSDNEYQLYTSLNGLEDETIYTYADSYSEKIEKALKNAARKTVRSIISSKDNKLPQDYTDDINNIIDAGLLKNVELIPQINVIYPGGNA